MDLTNFPAPFLGGPLTGRTEGAAGKRNAESAALAFENFRAYGYVPVAAPPVGTGMIEVDGEAKEVKATADGRPYIDVLSRKGEIIAAWFGYPGSEHPMVAECAVCGKTVTVYNSHVRRGSSHAGCTVRGKDGRKAAVAELTGAPVVAPGPQAQRNGSSAPVEAPAATEATEAKDTAKKTRTRAVKASAESRPAPAPSARPPKLSKAQRAALELIDANPGKVIAIQRGSHVSQFLQVNGNTEQWLSGNGLIEKEKWGTVAVPSGTRQGRSLGKGNRLTVSTWKLTDKGRAVLGGQAAAPVKPAPLAAPAKAKEAAPVGKPSAPARAPRFGRRQWEALQSMWTMHRSMAGLEEGAWNPAHPGWHQGSMSATVRVMESLVRLGYARLDDAGVYRMTGEGVSAYRNGYDVPPLATGGGLEEDADQAPELDADDEKAVSRLAARAGLTPSRRRPRSARAPKDGEAAEFPELAELLTFEQI